jgi:hypothetical protein
VLVWAIVALFLANLPYLLGVLLSTPSMVFGGAVYGVQDVNSYFAKMRQGAQGAWLFQIPYTVEAHAGTIIYIFYLLLGKVSRLTGLSLELVYHVARLVCGVFLLVTVYSFVAFYTPHRAVRRTAFLLIAFSSGLGWLMTVVGATDWLGTISLDLISPEAYTFLTLYSPPHLALATSCLLWGVLCVAQGSASHDLWTVLLGMVALWVLSLIGAFYLVVPFSVLGVHWLRQAVRQHRPDWRALGWIALSAIPAVGVLLYNLYYFVFDPVYSVWAAQNLVPALHPLHYMAGYHIVALLAVVGVWLTRRRWQGREVPIVWLVLVPILLLAPFSAARRLIIGAQVPLGLFAAEGWIYGVALPFGRLPVVQRLCQHPRYTRAGMRRWITAVLILTTFPTNLLLVLGNCVEVAKQEAPIYHSQAELDVLDWLGMHTRPSDAVLCAYETGNYVPARAGNRVLLGLGPETLYAERKKREVQRFFDADTAQAWRRELLARYGIAYVLVGPTERALGQFDPSRAPYLDLAYANVTYSVYRVRGEG